MGINNQLAVKLLKLNLKPQNLKPRNSKPRHIACGRYLTECKCANKAKQ